MKLRHVVLLALVAIATWIKLSPEQKDAITRKLSSLAGQTRDVAVETAPAVEKSE